MNLAGLHQRVRDGDVTENCLEYLLAARPECELLEFKETLNLLALAKLANHAIGMTNLWGGYIVLGVQDKTWRVIGLDKQLVIDGTLADSKLIQDKVRKEPGVDIKVYFVNYERNVAGVPRWFAMMLVVPRVPGYVPTAVHVRLTQAGKHLSLEVRPIGG